MAISLEEYESVDMQNLLQLKDTTGFQLSFGVSSIQYSLRIGYNRAARLVEAGIRSCILVRCDKTSHFVKI